ncbi:hypothetical protein BHE90_017380 [Fusarium euwallaceae]|uniref:Uncharacterized protein n=1 Tax=Fusarium euwallaceae TaxID=1147111 RepID=A0A430KXR7_9HYPO|nr:hypothetical protein BHE90_017380 [Fusarium euwallaceae]
MESEVPQVLPQLITQTVLHYQRMERRPHGAKEALQEARQASETSLDATILRKGQKVWLAYYGINKSAEARRLSANRRRTTVENTTIESHTEASVLPTIMTGSADTHSVDVERRVTEQITGHTVPPRDVYVGAALEPAKELFDEQLWNSIERIPNPRQPNKRAADISMFRGELHDAARESPIYLREKDDLLDYTDGISLTLSSQAKEGGKITVFLGEWTALSIKARLYG